MKETCPESASARPSPSRRRTITTTAAVGSYLALPPGPPNKPNRFTATPPAPLDA